MVLSGSQHKAKAFVLSELVELLRNGRMSSGVPVAPDQFPRVERLNVWTQTGKQDVGIVIGSFRLGDFSANINDLIWGGHRVDVLVASCCSGLRGSADIIDSQGTLCRVIPEYVEFKHSSSIMPIRLVIDSIVRSLFNRIMEV